MAFNGFGGVLSAPLRVASKRRWLSFGLNAPSLPLGVVIMARAASKTTPIESKVPALKPSSRNLKKRKPTEEEARQVVDTLLSPNQPPIVTAILGQAIIEYELDNLLRRRVSRKDDTSWIALIEDGGPFSTFHAKIHAGYSFKFYGEITRDNLTIIKNIRNGFAHTQKLITFDNEDILADLRKLHLPHRNHKQFKLLKQAKEIKHKGLVAYVSLCMFVYFELGRKSLESMKSRTRYLERRNRKWLSPFTMAPPSPMARGLLGNYLPSGGGLGTWPGLLGMAPPNVQKKGE